VRSVGDANAENNHGLDPDDLIVKEAYVGKKLTLRRFAARGRGKSSSIMKPFSVLTIVVKAKAAAPVADKVKEA
jgi:large subunit ribosomal protein L22